MTRVCTCAAAALAVVALSAVPGAAQSVRADTRSGRTAALNVDPAWLVPREWQRAKRTTEQHGVDPVLPLQPLIDRLPLQVIPELLKAEKRIGFTFDNYRVKPRVGLHELAIVVTRPLSQ